MVVIGLLRHALRQNHVILAHRQRGRVSQRESAPFAQKAAVRIGSRNLLEPRFVQPVEPRGNLGQLLLQPRHHFVTDGDPCSFVGIFCIALSLPAANVSPDARPRVPQHLLGVDSIPRSVRCDARRINRHMAQLAHFCFPRQFHHLREQIVQPLPVPSAKLVQRPVIRRCSRRQIAERQILSNPLFQPPRTRHAERIGVQPNRNQHLRRVRRSAFLAVLVPESFEVQFRNHPADEKAQVVRLQHVAHGRRQQIHLIRVVIQKFRHRVSSLAQYKGRVNPSSHTDSLARVCTRLHRIIRATRTSTRTLERQFCRS